MSVYRRQDVHNPHIRTCRMQMPDGTVRYWEEHEESEGVWPKVEGSEVTLPSDDAVNLLERPVEPLESSLSDQDRGCEL